MAPTLANPFYYLENFRSVLAWVSERHADLLDTQERNFVSSFPLLPQAAQALLVRMVMRKGELFRQSKLHYPEIGDPQLAAQTLASQGWVDPQPTLTLAQLAGLLKKEELVQAFSISANRCGARKGDLLQTLLADFGGEARTLHGWYPGLADAIYALRVGAICDSLRLLYFGNLRQDWSEFVLADLGIFSYEEVELAPASRAFQNRADVDAYMHLYHCRERFHDGELIDSVLADIPALPYVNSWLEGRRTRLLFQLGQQREKLKDWPGALQIYRDCSYPGTRARIVRVLEQQREFCAALAAAEAAMRAPESEHEQQQLSRILPRLRRKLGLAAVETSKPAPPETLTLILSAAPGQPVELLAREHVNRANAPAYYVENALINSLFGLLCWPAIFAPVPGAFFHPFQQGPADLHTPDFYQHRADIFIECFRLLESDAYRRVIIDTWRRKQGRQSPFVFWDLLNEDLLALALDCIPPTHLHILFTRLLLDIRANRSGFPDLVQFWPEEKRYLMLEVKGPGDRLQDNQRRWLDYCRQHGIPVAVCHVRWAPL